MQSVLLWYQTFKGCLEDIGFKLNPYDPCVANRDINGKQCTICWYVDDAKISHVDKTVVDWVISKIESKVGKMTVIRGHKHTFVGVDIEFIGNGAVSLSIDDYVEECTQLYQHEIRSKAATPAKCNLFDEDTSEDLQALYKEEAENFHHATEKIDVLAKTR